jgi:hypothetical protein
MRNGCREIVRRPNTYNVNTEWHGGCLFGLIHGAGGTTFYYEGKPTAKDYQQFLMPYPYGYYYGRVLPYYSSDFIYIPSSENRPVQLTISFIRNIKPPSWRDLRIWKTSDLSAVPHVLNLNGKETSFYAVYRREDDSSGQKSVTIEVEVRKQPCLVDGGRGIGKFKLNAAIIKSYDTVYPFELVKPIEARVIPHCQAALKRRLKALPAEGVYGGNLFDNVDYGHFFVVIERRVEQASGNIVWKTGSIDLCPAFNDVNSCEPIWRAKSEPYFKEFEELKPVVRRERAQLIADLDRLYAPLRVAMRHRAKELKLP